MAALGFRLSRNEDPEERLEEAALWKAMHDEYGDEIEAISNHEIPDGMRVFGRPLMYGELRAYIGQSGLPYWYDPAVVSRMGRSFAVCDIGDVEGHVESLHQRGLGAFIKSTKEKQAIFRVPVGADAKEVIGAMAYSFIDGGPKLMVQEMVEMQFEHRFFCIDREIVTHSPVQIALTPIDYPLEHGTVYETPRAVAREIRPKVLRSLHVLAQNVAYEMAYPHASIDCAIINGAPGVIELNPMALGQLGLYACDVRALAKASRKLAA